MYYINAVDEVTQWQVMLRQFPFHIRGFHSDNGSEYINYSLSDLLERPDQVATASLQRQCTEVEQQARSFYPPHLAALQTLAWLRAH